MVEGQRNLKKRFSFNIINKVNDSCNHMMCPFG